MPTPFMHIRAAHRFLHDPEVPSPIRTDLSAPHHLGAFLLGNVAPDARVSGGLSRANTHFFEYQAEIDPPASVVMLSAYPQLNTAEGEQRAFVAGYVAHLAMDVVWAVDLLYPYFVAREWGDQGTRFIMLHVLLCHLDARDYRQWEGGYNAAIASAEPDNWLPFLSDADLVGWRDVVEQQICPTCDSQTVAVLGARVRIGEDGLRAILENPARMQAELWDHVPRSAVDDVEDTMYRAMVQQVVDYMSNRKFS